MKFFAFNSDGAIYQATLSMCDNPKDVLASLVDSQVIYAGHIVDGIHCGIALQNGATHAVFAKEASHLRLSAQFAVHPDVDGGELRHFVDYKGGVKACVDWIVPDGYRLFFTKDAGGLGGGYGMTLVDSDGGFRMVPMSNCYEDCRVCTGTMNLPDTSSQVEAFGFAFDTFWRSDWNDHETHARLFSEHNRYIFRWDMEMNQLPMIDPENHLPKACPRFTGTSIMKDIIDRYPKKTYGQATEPKVGEPIIEEAKDD